MADIRVSIDRGGTFCDVVAHVDGREPIIFKLLSEDPANYRDAPTEAIRRVLELVEGRPIPVGQKLDGTRIAGCRVGTTVATNALLEHKGDKFAFMTTKGFADICVIGDQSRPKLFDLNVRKPKALHDTVVEVDERVTIEDYDLNPAPLDFTGPITDPALVRTQSGEVIRVITPLTENTVCQQLQQLRNKGYESLGVAFMHAHVFPDHEARVAQLAKELGFKYVTTSSETSPVIKLLNRSNSTCSEAYLYPIIRRYVENFEAGFEIQPQRVEFMCSDGGLKQAQKFKGNEALLSGPAGGVVGIARSCYDKDDGTPIIGFDMGGTSTDVSRFDGKYDHLTETTIAGRTISVPMLNIATVAAGGGSILFARSGLLVVGPESAGAHPGPACYRKGGPLTVTDANLFLGRLVVSSFPSIFGKNADEPLDADVVAEKFQVITKEFNEQTSQKLTAEEVASGFLNVANEAMSRPIRNATEARGFTPEKHNLVSFGGAGGQHACAIAEKLGIKRILIHKWSSLLSAYGISQAELQYETYEPYAGNFSMDVLDAVRTRLQILRKKASLELTAQGATETSLSFDESLVLRYFGTDTTITVSKPADEDYGKAFKSLHLREFAFNLERKIVIDSIKVRGTGSAVAVEEDASALKELSAVQHSVKEAKPQSEQRLYTDGKWQNVGVYRLEDIPKQTVVPGPALIIDKTQTIVVESQFKGYILSSHVVLERDEAKEIEKPVAEAAQLDETINPIQLSVFAHRFMSIAEQMGNTLQRTSISTSIKERLDFSCAIFSPDGKLVANAPHIPIHLGSMQFAIQYQHRLWAGKLKPGDVLLTNHPQTGGTHLPDLTVVSPVFVDDKIAFYVASRGHHTDIGGKGITSMMPESKELWEEGINIKSMKIVSGGEFLEEDIRAAFDRAGSFPGCSATRRINDNLSDLKAQIASNQRGITLLDKMCREFGLGVVHTYMFGIQANAEVAVRDFFKRIARDHPKPLTATDYFDDGTALKLKITIDPNTGGAIYDFAGTGPQSWGNYNCPISITHSAIIYTIRCLVNVDIPLNEGCLAPVDIRVPRNTILNPSPAVAVCGSTLASQRVVDTILRAFGRCAASQGCANSFGWGMGGRDPATGKIVPGWSYGEALGGGVGAGPGWHGESAVNVHSTNTRNTDAEVIEKRTAVIVRRYAVRKGSGGRGQFNGGNGTIREIEARIPLKCSILSDRRVYAPYGMNGGRPGKKGENYVFKFSVGDEDEGEDEDEEQDPEINGHGAGDKESSMKKIALGGKAVVNLEPGEIMQINTPGGGGWGKPDCDDSEYEDGP
ncbi:Hydantoinase B/oxoprolinase-domain-containing protein [Microdochium trichocladiopsis]|uniref:Hydantoinase B/oxoprolinase-domain-containing protein n=1 Tax=Microdochium trichocladiopsis TaxID=1682393 RepID=A0A9P8XW90_9PEZI|nr:Hydantoinase B/oxoprolinase-domain-containing protein [Microdochium trichocladiopsis]KAH7021304.1 Hydantoinase B/oxoprolinase-domain-containing protein [Microdochium trichocladiopsis]